MPKMTMRAASPPAVSAQKPQMRKRSSSVPARPRSKPGALPFPAAQRAPGPPPVLLFATPRIADEIQKMTAGGRNPMLWFPLPPALFPAYFGEVCELLQDIFEVDLTELASTIALMEECGPADEPGGRKQEYLRSLAIFKAKADMAADECHKILTKLVGRGRGDPIPSELTTGLGQAYALLHGGRGAVLSALCGELVDICHEMVRSSRRWSRKLDLEIELLNRPDLPPDANVTLLDIGDEDVVHGYMAIMGPSAQFKDIQQKPRGELVPIGSQLQIGFQSPSRSLAFYYKYILTRKKDEPPRAPIIRRIELPRSNYRELAGASGTEKRMPAAGAIMGEDQVKAPGQFGVKNVVDASAAVQVMQVARRGSLTTITPAADFAEGGTAGTHLDLDAFKESIRFGRTQHLPGGQTRFRPGRIHFLAGGQTMYHKPRGGGGLAPGAPYVPVPIQRRPGAKGGGGDKNHWEFHDLASSKALCAEITQLFDCLLLLAERQVFPMPAKQVPLNDLLNYLCGLLEWNQCTPADYLRRNMCLIDPALLPPFTREMMTAEMIEDNFSQRVRSLVSLPALQTVHHVAVFYLGQVNAMRKANGKRGILRSVQSYIAQDFRQIDLMSGRMGFTWPIRCNLDLCRSFFTTDLSAAGCARVLAALLAMVQVLSTDAMIAVYANPANLPLWRAAVSLLLHLARPISDRFQQNIDKGLPEVQLTRGEIPEERMSFEQLNLTHGTAGKEMLPFDAMRSGFRFERGTVPPYEAGGQRLPFLGGVSGTTRLILGVLLTFDRALGEERYWRFALMNMAFMRERGYHSLNESLYVAFVYAGQVFRGGRLTAVIHEILNDEKLSYEARFHHIQAAVFR